MSNLSFQHTFKDGTKTVLTVDVSDTKKVTMTAVGNTDLEANYAEYREWQREVGAQVIPTLTPEQQAFLAGVAFDKIRSLL